MSDSAIITFNADREKLANNLGKALKASNKAITKTTDPSYSGKTKRSNKTSTKT